MRGYAALAGAVLAVALAASVTVFALVDALYLRPLPYPEADRLREVVLVDQTSAARPDFHLWRAMASIPPAQGTAAAWLVSLNVPLRHANGVEEAPVIFATSELGPMLGVTVIGGRGLDRSDNDGTDVGALLVESVATRAFGDWRAAIGQALEIGGERIRVVGVIQAIPPFPPGRRSAAAIVSRPFPADGNQTGPRLRSLVRLEEGVQEDDIEWSLSQAVSAAGGLAFRVVSLRSPHEQSETGRLLLMLQTVVLSMLVVAWLSCVLLLLLRQRAKQGDIAIRLALGARWRHIIHIIGRDVVLVFGAATLAATPLALLSVGWLQRLLNLETTIFRDEPTFHAGNVTLLAVAGLVLAGTAWAVLTCAVGRHARRGASELLATRSGGRSRGQRWQGSWLGLQAAVATPICIVSIVFLRSYVEVSRIDPGFDPSRVVSAMLVRGPSHQALEHTMRVLEVIQSDPEVVAAAGSGSAALLDGSEARMPLWVGGQPVQDIAVRRVTHGYVRTVGLTIARGRDLQPADGGSRILVNDLAASTYWPDADPIGQTVRLGAREQYEVVGVVRSARMRGLLRREVAEFFLPIGPDGPAVSQLIIRTRAEPSALLFRLRTLVQSSGSGIDLGRTERLADRVDEMAAPFRTRARLIALCALLTLLVTFVATLAVFGDVFSTRHRELATRMAVGASRKDIVMMLTTDTGRAVGIGVVAGIVAYALLAGGLQAAVYEIAPRDPVLIFFGAATAMLASLLVIFVQAVCLSRIDLARAMKSEG